MQDFPVWTDQALEAEADALHDALVGLGGQAQVWSLALAMLLGPATDGGRGGDPTAGALVGDELPSFMRRNGQVRRCGGVNHGQVWRCEPLPNGQVRRF